jgi:sporadic carbohydrate cluster protein (TIGR04323 family)
MAKPATAAPGAGYRGYIASRAVNGVAYPHRVQNLVIRDYCRRKGLQLRLAATEVAVPGSHMTLNDVLARMGGVQGIVLFSQFLLPPLRDERQRVYERVLATGGEIHAALEDAVLRSATDIAAFDQVLRIAPLLALTPNGGRFRCGDPALRDALFPDGLPEDRVG